MALAVAAVVVVAEAARSGLARLPLPNDLALDLARPFVPPGLVTDGAWARLRDTAARVPRGFGYSCVETRLDDDDQVDLLLCATTFDHNRETLAASVAAGGLGAIEAVAPLVQAWVAPGTVIHARMPQLWVEIDHPGGVPCDAFAHLRIAPFEMDLRRLPTPPSLAEAWALVEAGLATTSGRGVSSASRGALRRVCEAMPENAVLMYVNAPASRGRDTLRCEFAVPAARLRDSFHAVGWPGNHADVGRLVDRLPPSAGFAVVWTVDDGALRPTVSLEPSVSPPDSPEAWQAVFAVAREVAGASPAKVDTLHTWVGTDPVDHPALGWPAAIERGFDVKFVVGESGAIRTKAYLVFRPRFRLFG